MGNVIEIYPLSLASDECQGCGDAHHEVGVLCQPCRVKQTPAPEAMIQASIASSIAEMRRYQSQGFPMGAPLEKALDCMRRAYDAAEPHIEAPLLGVIEVIEGELWAYPEGSTLGIGPFADEESAQRALTDRAADAKEPA